MKQMSNLLIFVTLLLSGMSASAQCFDPDGDGYGRAADVGCPGYPVADCAEGDPDLWSRPSEVRTLTATDDAVDPNRTVWSWDPPENFGGTAPVTYELLSAPLPNSWFQGIMTCELEGYNDTVSPPLDGVSGNLYYLVRATSGCGPGTTGLGSDGLSRYADDCPASRKIAR